MYSVYKRTSVGRRSDVCALIHVQIVIYMNHFILICVPMDKLLACE